MVIGLARLDVLLGLAAAADAGAQSGDEAVGLACEKGGDSVSDAKRSATDKRALGSASSSPPRSRSARVARIVGSTESMRATALRDSRGSRRKIESAAPALYVVSDEMDVSRGRPPPAPPVGAMGVGVGVVCGVAVLSDVEVIAGGRFRWPEMVGDGGSDASGAAWRTWSSERRWVTLRPSDVPGREAGPTWTWRDRGGGEAGTVSGSFSGASAVGIGREKTRSAAESLIPLAPPPSSLLTLRPVP